MKVSGSCKQWLNRARRLDREIDNLLKIEKAIRDQATSITQRYTGDTAQSTKDPHKFDRLVEINDRIDRKIDQLADIRNEIFDTIGLVENTTYRQILSGRYIACWTWEKIAIEIHYSYPQTVRLHGFALKAIEPLILAQDHDSAKDDKQ